MTNITDQELKNLKEYASVKLWEEWDESDKIAYDLIEKAKSMGLHDDVAIMEVRAEEEKEALKQQDLFSKHPDADYMDMAIHSAVTGEEFTVTEIQQSRVRI